MWNKFGRWEVLCCYEAGGAGGSDDDAGGDDVDGGGAGDATGVGGNGIVRAESAGFASGMKATFR